MSSDVNTVKSSLSRCVSIYVRTSLDTVKDKSYSKAVKYWWIFFLQYDDKASLHM